MRNINSLITALVLALSPVIVGCAASGDEATDSIDDESSAPGSFDLWQATDGQWHFHLVSGNGRTLLTSEAYTSEAAAWNGAFAVQTAAASSTAFAVKTSADGRYYFTLTADNGQIVGVSQMYTSRTAAQAGVTSVQSLMASMDLI